MRTRENQSTDWATVRSEYRRNVGSIRSLAKRFNVSDTAIRKRAEAESWVRIATESGSREPGKPSSWNPLTDRFDALATALLSVATIDGREADRRYVAAMLCLGGAAPAAIVAAMGTTEQVDGAAKLARAN